MPRIGRYFMPNMKRGAMGFMQSGDFPVPVLHLKFGKNTGTVAYDSSPNKLNGVIDGASWVKGYLGPGLSFDNLDDYVYVPDNDLLDNIVCFEARVNPIEEIAHATGYHILVNKHTTWMHGLHIAYNASPNQFIVNFHNGTNLSEAFWTIPAYNKMYHIIGQLRNLKAELYVNGVLKTTGPEITGHAGDNDQPVRIGGGTVNRYTKTIIDEILCYDEILTPAQILQRYQGYR